VLFHDHAARSEACGQVEHDAALVDVGERASVVADDGADLDGDVIVAGVVPDDRGELLGSVDAPAGVRGCAERGGDGDGEQH
jgi:hypothetical protein